METGQDTKNSLNFVSTCLNVVDTRRAAYRSIGTKALFQIDGKVTQALQLSDAFVLYSSRDNKSIFQDKTACCVSFNQNCVRDPVGSFND